MVAGSSDRFMGTPSLKAASWMMADPLVASKFASVSVSSPSLRLLPPLPLSDGLPVHGCFRSGIRCDIFFTRG